MGPPEYVFVRDCHGFCHGFTWGMGQGTDLCTPEKPVPVARVHGFDEISNSARNHERVPAHFQPISAHYNLSTTTTTLEIMNRDSKGGEMGGASTHLPKVCFSLHFFTNITLIVTFADCKFH